MAWWVPMVVGAVQAIGAMNSAKAERNAARYNAQLADQNATIARQQASAEEARQRNMARKQLGAMRAGYGASGLRMEGTPLDVLGSSAAEAELDALNIRYGGELQARGYEADATISRYSGKKAMQAGYWKAGSSLLSGAAGAYSNKMNLTGSGGGG